jgi:23S rRNA (guanosine2251-2'-O)-methyltransferase
MNQGHEIVYGRQPVRELLRAGRRPVFRVWLARESRPTPETEELLRLARDANAPVSPMAMGEFGRLSNGGHHQGVAAETAPYRYFGWESLTEAAARAGHDPLLFVLDHIQDPQNLGALLRTADAAGADGVIIPNRRAACVTPAAVRASAGAAEHVRVAMVVNIAQTLARLADEGVRFVGLEAVPEARDYTEVDFRGPLGLVLGGEGEGVKRLVREHCDALARLPMRGRIGSLNVAVAGAIVAYEALRQRGRPATVPVRNGSPQREP